MLDETPYSSHTTTKARNEANLVNDSGFIENGLIDDKAKPCRREWSCCHSADPFSRFCAKAPRD
jgi:hypothetical protein